MSCHRLHAENKRKYIERKTMGRGRGSCMYIEWEKREDILLKEI